MRLLLILILLSSCARSAFEKHVDRIKVPCIQWYIEDRVYRYREACTYLYPDITEKQLDSLSYLYIGDLLKGTSIEDIARLRKQYIQQKQYQ